MCIKNQERCRPLLSQAISQPLVSSTLNVNTSANVNDSTIYDTNNPNHISKQSYSYYVYGWNKLNLEQIIAKLMNPHRYIDAGEGLQYKAERCSEMQVGNKTITYSDYGPLQN